MRFIWPCEPHHVTRGFSFRDKIYYGGVHGALDIVRDFDGRPGDPLVAVADGILQHNPFLDANGGWTCWIDTPDGWRITYYHMMQPSPIPSGARVAQGQVIGYMGATGLAMGVHVHFMMWHKVRQSPESLARPNGWWAHDPALYLGTEEDDFMAALTDQEQRDLDTRIQNIDKETDVILSQIADMKTKIFEIDGKLNQLLAK